MGLATMIMIVLSFFAERAWGFNTSTFNCARLFARTNGIPIRGSNLIFHHGVNSRASLEKFIASGAKYAEGDVSIGRDGNLIMTHPPIKDSDLTFVEWVHSLVETGRNIKVDLKDPRAVDLVIDTLESYGLHQQEFKGQNRLIVHANIVKGPLSPSPIFSAKDLQKVRRHFPHAIISLGITLTGESPVIGPKVLSKLKSEASKIGNPITFSIRATHATPAIIAALSDIQAGRNITFWEHPSHKVSPRLYQALVHMAPNAFFDLREPPSPPWQTGT